jgi:hypothetical protein
MLRGLFAGGMSIIRLTRGAVEYWEFRARFSALPLPFSAYGFIGFSRLAWEE